MDKFLAGDCIGLKCDPFKWWRDQKPSDVSLLVPLAKRLLAIPASNGDVERLFSICAKLFDKLRSGMAEETIESFLQCSMNMEGFGLWKPAPSIASEEQDCDNSD